VKDHSRNHPGSGALRSAERVGTGTDSSDEWHGSCENDGKPLRRIAGRRR
jgi:hypothetical protein